MSRFLRLLRRCPARVRRPAGARPAFEELESRALPTVLHPLSCALAPQDNPGAIPGYTPAQIWQAYGIGNINFGSAQVRAGGQGQTIAIVTAYDDPTLADDLAAFNAYFNIPAPPSLVIVGQDGSDHLPAADAGWAQETALDVEWAHAIAPQANLIVVEANSADAADLYAAADTAAALPGVAVVSMSFGGPEDASETNADTHFAPNPAHPAVTFVAAAGDSSAVTYPAVSPDVVGVGGTTLTLDAQGNRAGETAWARGGGGLSQYEATPAFQQNVPPARLAHRGSPDVAYDADPSTGFAVYDSYNSPEHPWVSVGGTSAGAPQWAALLAIANQGRALGGQGALAGAAQVLPLLYQLQGSAFFDITSGGNGHYQAGPGYDLVTGLGSPNAQTLIAGLMKPGGHDPGPTPPPGSGGDGGPTQPPGSPGGQPTTSLIVTGLQVSAVAGTPLNSILATVRDDTGLLTADALAATIDWGNGRSSTGTIVPLGDGHFAVTGVLDYAQPGTYTITITVTANTSAGAETATAQTLATIESAPAGPANPLPVEPLAVPVADPIVPSGRQAISVVRPRHGPKVHHVKAHPVRHQPQHPRPSTGHA